MTDISTPEASIFVGVEEEVALLLERLPGLSGEDMEDRRRRLRDVVIRARQVSELRRAGAATTTARVDPREPYLKVEVEGREPLAIRPGSVEFSGRGDYDVIVKVELDEDGAVPRVVVSEVTFRRRPAGRELGSRGVHGANVHEFLVEAIDRLTEIDHPDRVIPQRVVEAGPLVRSAMKRGQRRRGRPPLISDGELRLVADLYRSAPPGQREESAWRTYAATQEAISRSAFRYRCKRARKLIDPLTGRTFLP
jgi:hypothetical protein